jgi:glucose 1-dehydrogenase
VTGASNGGIGGAICHRLAEDAERRGDKLRIVLSATGRQPGLTTLLEDLQRRGVEANAITGDLTDPVFARDLASEAVSWCDGLDVAVANAGMAEAVPLTSAGLEHWEKLFAVHTRAPWLIAQGVFESLRQSGGSFIATASTSGMAPHAGLGAYSSAKAALIMMCQTLALEWGPEGVRVNAVSPGAISTPISAKTHADPDTITANAARRAKVIPLRRLGAPEDVAAAVSFLAGPDGAYVTGEHLVVDGGLLRSVNQQL